MTQRCPSCFARVFRASCRSAVSQFRGSFTRHYAFGSGRPDDRETVAIGGQPGPILMLTARDAVSDMVHGLDLGAVDLSTTDGYAIASVMDSGIGISPEDLARIFDRFWRMDKVRSRHMGGAGLGLSIARWIIDRQQGTIEVRSSPGKGSTFTFKVPLAGVPGASA